MLDQCTITLPNGPLVKPEIFTNEKFMIDGWLQFAGVNDCSYRTFAQEGPISKKRHSFDLFGPRVLRFSTRCVGTNKTPYQQVINKIELNLAKVAHGHNAIPISHPQELCGLLILVRQALRGVLNNPDEASSLIPGLVHNSRANWSKIEIGSHIKDPGQIVYKAMSRMRSKYARKMEKFDNTVRLKGTNIILKAYDKASEMVAKKHSTRANLDPSTDDPITRLEVQLWGEKLTWFDFLPEEQRPLTRLEDGKAYLEGFTLDQLREIYRFYFSELKSIYHAPKMPGEGDVGAMAAVLAAIHQRTDMPIEELCSIYTKLGMRDQKKPKTKDEKEKAIKQAHTYMRDKIEHALEMSSTLTADDLLSDLAIRNQPIIGVKGTYGVGEFFVKHYGIESIGDFAIDPHADRQIKDVYMDRPSGKFILESPPLELDSKYELFEAL